MIIGVNFKDKLTGEYGSREYNYLCDLPGVAIGDIVVAPSVNGDSVVQVCSVDVPESKIDERIMPQLKTISEFASQENQEE